MRKFYQKMARTFYEKFCNEHFSSSQIILEGNGKIKYFQRYKKIKRVLSQNENFEAPFQ